MFGAGKCGLINPPDPAREFSLILAEVAAFDQDVYDLMMDMTVLYDMSKVCSLELLLTSCWKSY